MAELDAWLRLLQATGIGDSQILERLKQAGSPEAFLAESPRRLAAAGLSEESIHRLKTPDDAELDRWRAWLAGPQRALVPLGHPLYPPQLATLNAAPLALWVEGSKPELLGAPQLAMVGSRSPTRGGQDTALQFAEYFSTRGLVITSGLAVGIDAASHRGALKGVAGTIAVLGSGLVPAAARGAGGRDRAARPAGLGISAGRCTAPLSLSATQSHHRRAHARNIGR